MMFMSINPNETIDNVKALGREMVLITYNLMLFGQYIFGLIIANLVSKWSLSKYGMF